MSYVKNNNSVITDITQGHFKLLKAFVLLLSAVICRWLQKVLILLFFKLLWFVSFPILDSPCLQVKLHVVTDVFVTIPDLLFDLIFSFFATVHTNIYWQNQLYFLTGNVFISHWEFSFPMLHFGKEIIDSEHMYNV